MSEGKDPLDDPLQYNQHEDVNNYKSPEKENKAQRTRVKNQDGFRSLNSNTGGKTTEHRPPICDRKIFSAFNSICSQISNQLSDRKKMFRCSGYRVRGFSQNRRKSSNEGQVGRGQGHSSTPDPVVLITLCTAVALIRYL